MCFQPPSLSTSTPLLTNIFYQHVSAFLSSFPFNALSAHPSKHLPFFSVYPLHYHPHFLPYPPIYHHLLFFTSSSTNNTSTHSIYNISLLTPSPHLHQRQPSSNTLGALPPFLSTLPWRHHHLRYLHLLQLPRCSLLASNTNRVPTPVIIVLFCYH